MTRTRKSYRYYRARKQMILMLVAAVLVISLFFIGGSRLKGNQVQASGAYTQEICYKSIEVEKGDTLWTIADEYMTDAYKSKQAYIDEVKEINHLGKDEIQAGSYLMVPFGMDVQK